MARLPGNSITMGRAFSRLMAITAGTMAGFSGSSAHSMIRHDDPSAAAS